MATTVLADGAAVSESPAGGPAAEAAASQSSIIKGPINTQIVAGSPRSLVGGTSRLSLRHQGSNQLFMASASTCTVTVQQPALQRTVTAPAADEAQHSVRSQRPRPAPLERTGTGPLERAETGPLQSPSEAPTLVRARTSPLEDSEERKQDRSATLPSSTGTPLSVNAARRMTVTYRKGSTGGFEHVVLGNPPGTVITRASPSSSVSSLRAPIPFSSPGPAAASSTCQLQATTVVSSPSVISASSSKNPVTMVLQPAQSGIVLAPSTARRSWADMMSPLSSGSPSPTVQLQQRPVVFSTAASGQRKAWADMMSPLSGGSPSPTLQEQNAGSASFMGFHLSSPAPSVKDSDSEDEDPASDEQPKAIRRHSWSNYPTSPVFRGSAGAGGASSHPKASGAEPRIGIDVGGVITRDTDPGYCGSQAEWDPSFECFGAFDTIRCIVEVFGPENVFIVSKVRPGGSMHRKMEQWLHETIDFVVATGFRLENIVFVSKVDGPDGKGAAAGQLGLAFFIDDKIEVLKSIWGDEAGNSRHLVERFNGGLFHMSKGAWQKKPPDVDINDLAPMMRRHYQGVADWAELKEALRERLPGSLQSKAHLLAGPPQAFVDSSATVAQNSSAAARAAREPPPWARPQDTSQGAQATQSAQAQGTAQWRQLGTQTSAQVQGARPAVIYQVSSPTAKRAVSIQAPMAKAQAAPQGALSPSGRPKLQLLRRSVQATPDPAVAAPATAPAAGSAAPAKASQPAAPVASSGAAAKASQPEASSGRPRLQLLPRSAPAPPDPAVAAPSTAPAAGSAAPAKASLPAAAAASSGATAKASQPEASSWRPRLQLLPRSVPAPDPAATAPATGSGVAAKASQPEARRQAAAPAAEPKAVGATIPSHLGSQGAAALQPSADGSRPRLILKKRGEAPAAIPGPTASSAAAPLASVLPSPAVATVSQPSARTAPPAQGAKVQVTNGPAAVQRDPATGRPKLLLKPRTVGSQA